MNDMILFKYHYRELLFYYYYYLFKSNLTHPGDNTYHETCTQSCNIMIMSFLFIKTHQEFIKQHKTERMTLFGSPVWIPPGNNNSGLDC